MILAEYVDIWNYSFIVVALIALGTTGIVVYTKVRKGAKKHE